MSMRTVGTTIVIRLINGMNNSMKKNVFASILLLGTSSFDQLHQHIKKAVLGSGKFDLRAVV